MQSHTAQPNDHKWRQAFWFGLPLAALNLGLFAVATARSDLLTPPQVILAGLLLYLVIPGIAGYWPDAHGRYQEQESGWAGFRVGLVACGLFMLAATLVFSVLWIRYATVPPQSLHGWGLYDPTTRLITFATFLGILALLHSGGVALSVLGGRIGGALARRRAAMRVRLHEHQA